MALLRASGEHTGEDYDLSAVLGGNTDGSGIPHAAALVAFAEAAVGDDPAVLTEARDRVIAEMGEAALSDAACVAALFNAIDRVADSTGIPLEDEKAAMTEGLRSDLGINQFGQSVTDQNAAE